MSHSLSNHNKITANNLLIQQYTLKLMLGFVILGI